MSKTKTTGIILTWNAVPVGAVYNITMGGNPVTKIDISSFSSTIMEYRPGRKEASEFSFELHINPDDTVQIALEADDYAGTERTVTLVCPSGSINTITFTAKIANFQFGGEGNSVYKGQVTLQQTSLPART